jgi:metallo-beta-lactamase family protein
MSAHADRSEILQWLSTMPSAPKQVCLVHGEPRPMDSLKAEVERRFGWTVVTPSHGEKLTLG